MDLRAELSRRQRSWRIDAFKLWCWRRLLRVPWTTRRSNQAILNEINPEYSSEGLVLKLKLQYFGRLMGRANSLEQTLIWERLKAGGVGDNRGWDGWMASPTQWIWVWASSGRYWRTGKSEFHCYVVCVCSVISNYLRPHGLQHNRLPCPSPISRACSNSCPLSPWCHSILCYPFLLPPSTIPSIRVFSNESALCIRWPKYWSFSFSISPSNEYSGLISFRMD